MDVTSYGWLVLAFPLGGMVVCALGWRLLPGRTAGWVGTLAIGLSFASSVGMLLALLDRHPENRSVTSSAFDYVKSVGIDVNVGILVDPLSVFMCLVVSGVSFLIHLYSVAYMGSDRGYARYFAYLNFFVFSMLLLVLADNFVLLIVGWAFVGAASFLLISFWYRRRTATAAGIKAFVINVIGDVAMVVAAFLLLSKTGALDYDRVFGDIPATFSTNEGTLVAACLLLLVGAFAKSAQLPLHTWLPDAMEGPTPVSALIHAATMVTAGVYLIARAHPLFEQAPAAADVAAIVGAATLIFGASVAIVVTDLKRIIAYSTISQVGYMILGVASFAYAAGLFHLMSHAFFKALLFMGAGSVVAAMGGVQSIDRMGGFRRAMPFTFLTFTVGALALAGMPPLSGWLSKDDIIANVLAREADIGLYYVLGLAAYIGALLTAVYAFRMVFRVFAGEPVDEARELLVHDRLAHHEPANPATGEAEDTDVGFPGPEHHIAERSWTMRLAMAPLALLAIVGGVVGVPHVFEPLERFLEPVFAEAPPGLERPDPPGSSEAIGLVTGGAIAAIGVALAWYLFVSQAGITLELRRRFPELARFLDHKWYFDELYDYGIVRPARWCGRFGQSVVERVVVQRALVGGAGGVVRAGSTLARALQTGYLRAYAFMLVAGVAGIALYFLVVSA